MPTELRDDGGPVLDPGAKWWVQEKGKPVDWYDVTEDTDEMLRRVVAIEAAGGSAIVYYMKPAAHVNRYGYITPGQDTETVRIVEQQLGSEGRRVSSAIEAAVDLIKNPPKTAKATAPLEPELVEAPAETVAATELAAA